MKPKNHVDVKQEATTPVTYTIDSAVSQDGTVISYRRLGRGPGLIIVHGTMESAQSHMQLAEELADTYTVYLPDRRGRGLSGTYRNDHTLHTDVEDLKTIVAMSGARYVMGVSVGAIICLQAALEVPTIRKAALFEPPLIVDGSISTSFLARYDREIAEGRIAAALVTAMLGAQMGPPILASFPRWLLELLTKMMMASEEKKASGDDVTMRKLAQTIHYDHNLSVETEGKLERFKDVGAELLLLGGSRSPAYFKTALDALEKLFPRARRVEFTGLHHGATGNSDKGGKPQLVAQELRTFFDH